MNRPDAHPAPAADVLVLQHLFEDGPGYLGEWLHAQGITWHLRCAEAGDLYPASVSGYRGLAVLGGAWSANDERPTLRQAEALIREADTLGIPVIGHCLGGQLMARALGGQVQRLPQPEVGWWPIEHTGSAAARAWFGEERTPTVYQWHQDSFTELPPGAELLASSATCAHQAFALRQHLAMQFHIEITPAKIEAWLANAGSVYPQAVEQGLPTVQSPAAMRASTAQHQAGSQALVTPWAMPGAPSTGWAARPLATKTKNSGGRSMAGPVGRCGDYRAPIPHRQISAGHVAMPPVPFRAGSRVRSVGPCLPRARARRPCLPPLPPCPCRPCPVTRSTCWRTAMVTSTTSSTTKPHQAAPWVRKASPGPVGMFSKHFSQVLI